MSDSQTLRAGSSEGELHDYLNERPELLLKMLCIAENCWHESRAVVQVLPQEQGLAFEHA